MSGLPSAAASALAVVRPTSSPPISPGPAAVAAVASYSAQLHAGGLGVRAG